MNIAEASKQLQALSKAHARNQISLDNYLNDRKILLDSLDQGINGISPKAIPQPLDMEQTIAIAREELDQVQEDKTQPYFASKVDKYMSFIKGSNKN